MLARHVAGDTTAFGELVELFGPAVYGYLKRSGLSSQTADDLFQETFLRVHQSARRFEASHAFRAWLFTIAGNLVRSHLRKKRVRRILVGWWRRSPRNGDDGEPEPFDPADPSHTGADEVADARERLRWLERALTDLPDGPREALLLTQVEGLPYGEAAEALGVPLPTVKTWVRRGRLALAGALAEAEERGAS